MRLINFLRLLVFTPKNIRMYNFSMLKSITACPIDQEYSKIFHFSTIFTNIHLSNQFVLSPKFSASITVRKKPSISRWSYKTKSLKYNGQTRYRTLKGVLCRNVTKEIKYRKLKYFGHLIRHRAAQYGVHFTF